MPQGLPQKGDRGLDWTHTWGRTYWGGAIFSLLADVKIRQQTKNTKGLEHALRAILERGGDIRSSFDLSQALRIGDGATGTRVLQDLYEQMKDKPARIDLDAIWADLGVRLDDQEVRFDERAPSAAIRRAITGDSGLATEDVSHDRARTIFVGRTAGRSRLSR
jgi:predicted metalloprotease with PDZ domain